MKIKINKIVVIREAGKLMTNGTKKRIEVSTLAEAEFFALGGFDDILYGRLFTPDKLSRYKCSFRFDILLTIILRQNKQ